MSHVQVITPCCARKRGRSIAKVRDLAQGASVARRFAQWHRLIFNPFKDMKHKAPRDIYTGPTWRAALRVEAQLQEEGHSTSLLVASAGYGLLSSERSCVEPYDATFSPGQPDSIGSLDDCRWWWDRLCAMRDLGASSLLERVTLDPDDNFMVIASSAYLSAMRNDLIAAVEAAGERRVLIVTSNSSDIPEALAPFVVTTTKTMLKLLRANCVTVNRV